MIITVSNKIVVTDPTPDIMYWAKQNLIINNPEYAKKARMNLFMGDTPARLALYEMHGDNLILPFGVLRRLPADIIAQAKMVSDFTTPAHVDYDADVNLYDYQERAVQYMLDAHFGILQSAAGSGKGLPLNAKIYTPHGFTRNGDLEIGDEICNSYGGISHVTEIFDRGVQPCYKISFTDGTSIISDSSHLWRVRNTRKHNSMWIELTTKELFDSGVTDAKGQRLYEIPISQPVKFNFRRVTIAPWLLGALLGDGGLTTDDIRFSNTEKDIVALVYRLSGGTLRHLSGCDYGFRDGGSIKYRLLDYGLFGKHSHEKFIPHDYLFNTAEIRLAVLRGLIDTDGSVNKTEVTITSTSKQLIEDCLFLVQSLGGIGKISERHTKYTHQGEVKDGKTSYRLSLKLYECIPFSSEKHRGKATARTKYTTPYRRIKSIEISAPRVTRCISVDSKDHLYLTDSFVVTHNTQMGIAIAAKLGRRALWLCHTNDLIKQSRDRALQYISSDLIGTITEGKVHLGSGITFATIQTMCKLDLSQYKNYWDCIITDEVHRVSGSPTAVTQYQKVLSSLAARHKYGLSATVHRSDGMIQATYALVGEVVCRIADEAIADKIMKVGIFPVNTCVELSRSCLNTDGTLNYTKLITYLCEDPARLHFISSYLVAESEHSCLILSDRLGHLEALMNTLPRSMREQAVMISGKMTSKRDKSRREKALEDMRTGKKKYLFATYSLAKEGLDIPRLERLFLATPQKDYAVVTQSIGRIARACDGKADPIAYDFIDNIGYLMKSYKKRCTTYRKNGCYFVRGDN